MKVRMFGTSLVVTAVLAWAAACGQPPPGCLVGRGGYAARYTLKPDQSVDGPCAQKKGEVLGVQKYGPPGAPSNQTIAIKTGTLVGLTDQPSGGQAQVAIISEGQLTSGIPDTGHWCTASRFNTAQDVQGGTDTAYAWSNVRFYVTPEIPGTQFVADLDYTEGGCTASYSVAAVFPAISCDDGTGTPDPSRCSGAGDNGTLDPDFPVACDPDVLLCVLSGPVPALKTSAKK